MKKLVIKSAFLIFVLTVICSLSIGLLVSPDTDGWFTHNEHLDANSNAIYSINQDYGNDLVQFEDIPKIYKAIDAVSRVKYIPGDVVYYTSIFRIALDDLVETKTDYYVTPVLDLYATEGASSDTGDYLSFGYNLCLEENSVLLVVLEKGTTTISPSNEEVESYTPIKYHYDSASGKMMRGALEGNSYAYFNYETPNAPFTNTGVEHFCDGVDKSSLQSNFYCVMPILGEYPVSTEEDVDYVYFMLYVPIWYVDIEEEQNNEMDCILEITSCPVLPVEPEPEVEPDPNTPVE